MSDSLHLRLQEIIQASGGSASGNVAPGMIVAGISTDSRHMEGGELFLALRGDKFDGHDFIGEALARGACAAIINKSRSNEYRVRFPRAVLIAVDDTLKALGEIARHHKNRFSIPIVAITGSVGKTSAKEFTAAVLAGRFATLKSEKSFNNAIGIPLTLLELRQRHEIAVLEMGTNHFDELTNLCRIAEPQYGVLLNIAEAHLEFFGTLGGVLRAKLELFSGLSGEKVGFYNSDDPLLAGRKMPLKRAITFGVKRGADVRADRVDVNDRGRLRFSYENIEIQLKVCGRHNVYNALAAVAVGREFGLSIEEIKGGLESVEMLHDRAEVREVAGVRIIDDVYNSNLRSSGAALQLLRELAIQGGGRSIAVLADMLELGEFSEKAHVQVGGVVAGLGIDMLLTFGRDSAHTTASARREGGTQCWHFDDKGELLDTLRRIVIEKDVVLVKGSRGMKMEEIVAGLTESLKRGIT